MADFINSIQLNGDKGKAPYTIVESNWFKSKPYGFAFYDKTQGKNSSPKTTIYLPISPSNIQISTAFATNIVTTLYSIVEEHSEVRYYDIVIQGTTGFAPRFTDEIAVNKKVSDQTSTGRDFFKNDDIINLGGFLPEVTNTIKQVAKIANDISNLGAVTNETGIQPSKTGYAAFHKLYQFFLKYKQDTSAANDNKAGSVLAAAAQFGPTSLIGEASDSLTQSKLRAVHPLTFLNYKDGVKYDCIPLSFNMSRSADNPMLYNYSIRLRAFNLRPVSQTNIDAADQLAKLGLGGAKDQSLFSQLTDVTNNAATLISGIL